MFRIHTQKGLRLPGFLLVLTVALALQCMAPAAAFSQEATWWSEKWAARQRIDITAPSGGDGQTLRDFPVLLRLHTGNFPFAQVQQAGQDIRFVDATDKIVLEHVIESYDILDEIAYVWVKLPQLGAGASTHMYMYYGNPEAPATGNTTKVFDPSTVSAFSFGETEGLPKDGTAYGVTVSQASVGQGFASIIGRGVSFNGVNDRIVLAPSPALSFPTGLSLSGWVRTSQADGEAVIASVGADDQFQFFIRDGRLGAILIKDEFDSFQALAEAALPQGEYAHVAVTLTATQGIALFVNGQDVGQVQVPGSLPDLSGGMVIGSTRDDAFHYAGEMDQFEVANAPRPSSWFVTQAASQGPQTAMLVYGAQEVAQTGSQSLYYLSVILDNITGEAWGIIGILIIISLISWLIMLTKGLFLSNTEKENANFLEDFDELHVEHLTELHQDEGDYGNSCIYSIYKAGCDEIASINRARQAGTETKKGQMSSNKLVRLLERSMERQFLRESQKLNSYLVFMTIAISGGPFLGLLGTVWGVMNTFAALSLAGEASLTAIAPGIASSLLTTVFGLIVAIPALFGYNYLITKIKGITLEMTAFMDEFSEKAEEII